MKQGHLIRDCPSLAKPQTDEQGFQSTERRSQNKGKGPAKPGKKNAFPPSHLNRFSPLLVEVHDPFDNISLPPSPRDNEEEGPLPQNNTSSPSSAHHNEEDKSFKATPGSPKTDGGSINVMPESPTQHSADSKDGETVEDTQLQSFAENLDSADQERRREIASQKSVDVNMTQAEEEALPPGNSKRKKERNNDANRASIQFAKPTKNFKKSS